MSAKFLIPIVFIAAIIVFLMFFRATDFARKNVKPKDIKSQQQKPSIIPARETTSTIFVPYWTVEGGVSEPDKYDRSIYFGITPNEEGINKSDVGYKNIPKYNDLFSGGQKLLAVRMMNSEFNIDVLENKALQERLISDTIEIAQESEFSGVVLDFELFSLFNDEVPGQINNLVLAFYRASKSNNLSFAVTIYGDTFYRKRPYDIKSIGNIVDELMIMAYDFSKSYGEPGPNFPLKGKDVYGYDMEAMIEDFANDVPREKLTIIFGMYGYDWTVDSQNRPLKPGDPLSFNEIEKKYPENCGNCSIMRDELAQETKIVAEDHVLWFEDLKSAQTKQEFMKSQGIGNFAYWAFGYF